MSQWRTAWPAVHHRCWQFWPCYGPWTGLDSSVNVAILFSLLARARACTREGIPLSCSWNRHRRRATDLIPSLVLTGVLHLSEPSFSLLFSLSGTYERRTFCTFWSKLHIQAALPLGLAQQWNGWLFPHLLPRSGKLMTETSEQGGRLPYWFKAGLEQKPLYLPVSLLG